MSEKFKDVPNVDIDNGKFKYVLIKVYDPKEKDDNFKYIVRGYSWAGFHGDVYDNVSEKITKLGLDSECVGGGRIIHNPEEKTINVFGYSQGFGQADHSITCKILQEYFKDYRSITHSNEGY